MRRLLIPLALLASGCPDPPCVAGDARPECAATPQTQDAGVAGPICKPGSRSLLISHSGVSQQIEGTVKSGHAVVVHYEGCEVDVLAGCTAPGEFKYQALTNSRRVVRMSSEADLQANAPIFFLDLKAKVAAQQGLALAVWTTGRFYASQSYVKKSELTGDCAGATHVISGMQAGAYELATSKSVSGDLEASFIRSGVSLKGKEGVEQLDTAGNFDQCAKATGEEKSALPQCGAAVALEFVRIGQDAAPPPPPEPCPPGMALVKGEDKLPSFCMDKTEVTAGAFAQCVSSGKCTELPTTSIWPGPTATPEALAERNPFCNGGKAAKADHPMNCVDKLQAAQYCEAQGKRLPTQPEWMLAAKDAGGGCLGKSGTCAVGTSPGATPAGIQDLVGNVWEITFSTSGAPNQFLVCGGAWGASDFPDTPKADCPYWMNQLVRSNIVGFRCARSL